MEDYSKFLPQKIKIFTPQVFKNTDMQPRIIIAI